MALLTPQNFRRFSFVEAGSFLLLLFVAMPLKYLAGLPLAVSVVGAVHGAVFVAYLALVGLVARRFRWTWGTILGAFVAAVLPFGPFVFDRWPRKRPLEPISPPAAP